MTINSGGGLGNKGRVTASLQGAVSTRASEKRKAIEAEARAVEEKKVSDSFEKSVDSKRRLSSAQPPSLASETTADLTEALGLVGDRPSAVTDLAQAFADRSQRLACEFESLRQQTQPLIDRLGQTGFAAATVAQLRPELDPLREQMGHLRSRIVRNNRRLKMLKSAAFNTPRFDAGRARKQTLRAARHEAAWRAGSGLVAMGGELIQGSLPTGQGVSRLALGAASAIDRHALGSYLSQIAPATMLSRFAVSLVEAGQRFAVRPPVDQELSSLHDDARGGRVGREFEELARYAESGNR
ncbi:MAG: hypothetical protein JXR83_06165 [Deltaproteobacteria bacterium]|nr:hypothetical protein [Deltaproteobacteria bacterium]